MSSSKVALSVIKWSDFCCLVFLVCCVSNDVKASFLSANRRGLSMQTTARHAGLDRLSRSDKLQLAKLLQRMNSLPLAAILDSETEDPDLESLDLLDNGFPNGIVDTALLQNGVEGREAGQVKGEPNSNNVRYSDPRREFKNTRLSLPVPVQVQVPDSNSFPTDDTHHWGFDSFVEPAGREVIGQPGVPSKRASTTESLGLLARLLQGSRGRWSRNKKAQPCFYNIITCY